MSSLLGLASGMSFSSVISYTTTRKKQGGFLKNLENFSVQNFHVNFAGLYPVFEFLLVGLLGYTGG
jgi:hypothetical protein